MSEETGKVESWEVLRDERRALLGKPVLTREDRARIVELEARLQDAPRKMSEEAFDTRINLLELRKEIAQAPGMCRARHGGAVVIEVQGMLPGQLKNVSVTHIVQLQQGDAINVSALLDGASLEGITVTAIDGGPAGELVSTCEVVGRVDEEDR